MKMNRNNHFTLSVIDSWGICSDKYNKQPGAVLSLNAVCAGSQVIIILQKSKQSSIGILSSSRDHRK